jgi:hypothetical protein
MAVRFQQVENLVYLTVGKPSALTLYGSGLALAFVAVGIFHGVKWLAQYRKGATWAK